jgi:hypothetical protein
MAKKICFIFCFILAYFFAFPKSVLAVTVSITNYPSTIQADPFTLTASVSGAATGTNYLRVDVYKEGTSNYFGETYNNSDWYSGSDGKQYLPITIQSGIVWTGTIQARIGNPSSSDYDGQGSYRVRVRRYTSSGGSGSEDANSSSVPIVISFPTTTPTPPPATATPKPTATDTPTPTQKSHTPTPTQKLTSTPSPVASITKFPTVTQSASISASVGMRSRQQAPTPKLVASISQSAQVLGVSDNTMGNIFIIMGGIVLCIACGILTFRYKKRAQKL